MYKYIPTPSTICGWPPGFTTSAIDGFLATSSISFIMDFSRATCSSPNNLESYKKITI